MKKLLAALLIAALVALSVGAEAQIQWRPKGIGASYLAMRLHNQGFIYAASGSWGIALLKYGTATRYRNSWPSTSIIMGSSLDPQSIGTSAYRYPNDYPFDPPFAGKTGPFVTPHNPGFGTGYKVLMGEPIPLGLLLPANPAKNGAPIRLWRQPATAVAVEGKDNTVRELEDLMFFAQEGERVVPDLWSDQAVVTRTVYPGAGVELTAWLYGSGTQGYTDHNIVTLDFHHTGRVFLAPGQPGYYEPGTPGRDHWPNAVPKEIADEKPTLKGFIYSHNDPPPGIAIYGLAEYTDFQQYYNEPNIGGDRGKKHYVYDDVNKMFYQTDGEDPDSPRKDIPSNRGNPVFASGPNFAAWNANIPKDETPGEFLSAATGSVVYLHVDETPADRSASPTPDNPTLANAKNLSVNALTDPALIGTEQEQPFQARIGEDVPIYPQVEPTVAYSFLTGADLPDERQARIGKPLNWFDRLENAGAFDFKAGKWKAGLDHASLSYVKKHTGSTDKSLGYAITFGPWDLPFGKHIHIAYAIVAGAADRALNQIMGQFYAKKKWLTRAELDQLGDLLEDWDYLQNYAYWKETFAKNAGRPFTESDKHAFLNSAIDSLYKEVQIVKQVWADGLKEGRFGPKYPALIGWPTSVSYRGGPGKADITWSPVPGAARYNVYRTAGTYGKQPRLIGAGVAGTSFVDTRAERAVFYYYSVAAVDAQGREGTRLMTMSTNPVIPTRVPAGMDWRDRVRVVPNPYSRLGGQEKDGGFNFTGGVISQNQVLFVNLPPRATINIFTTTGDLVFTVRHTSGTGDEPWYLITDNNQRPVSGLYFCHIRNDDAPGETKLLKLVVIR